jgi:uncharacterized protein with FMN-binding domain
MRRAVSVVVITAAAVVLVASFRGRAVKLPAGVPPPPRATPRTAQRGPHTRTADGILIQTPFSAVQVRATLTRGRLTGVETVALSGDDPHTQAINARAEPILRAEALRAHSAHIDAVSGATSTSLSYVQSLQSAIDRARRKAASTARSTSSTDTPGSSSSTAPAVASSQSRSRRR